MIKLVHLIQISIKEFNLFAKITIVNSKMYKLIILNLIRNLMHQNYHLKHKYFILGINKKNRAKS